MRVPASQFEDMIKAINPDVAPRVVGEKWEISGLPIGMGEHSLALFLEGWSVTPIYTFRQRGRRTWIVRAANAPMIEKVQHDQGLAWIRPYVPKPAAPSAKEKWHPEAMPKSHGARAERPVMQAPKSWASVAAARPSGSQGAFVQGKDLNIREVRAAGAERSSQAAPQTAASSEAAMVGKLDEILRNMGNLGARVDALAQEVTELCGREGDAMLTDSARADEAGRASRSPRGRMQKRLQC